MLQKSVGLYPAIGIPGQQVAFNQAVYTPQNYLSGGGFAFAVPASPTGTAVKFPIASLKGSAGAKPIGFVERTFTASIELGTDTPDIYPKGSELTIAVRGDYYIVAPAAATLGQAVLCDPTTGAITFGDAGAANATGWTVQTAGAKVDTLIISNPGFGYQPAASGS